MRRERVLPSWDLCVDDDDFASAVAEPLLAFFPLPERVVLTEGFVEGQLWQWLWR
jgi:hypothetical protein